MLGVGGEGLRASCCVVSLRCARVVDDVYNPESRFVRPICAIPTNRSYERVLLFAIVD